MFRNVHGKSKQYYDINLKMAYKNQLTWSKLHIQSITSTKWVNNEQIFADWLTDQQSGTNER